MKKQLGCYVPFWNKKIGECGKNIYHFLYNFFFYSFVYLAKHSDDNHSSDDEHGSKEELFKEMDLDKDNSISLVEFKEIYKKHSLEHERENN